MARSQKKTKRQSLIFLSLNPTHLITEYQMNFPKLPLISMFVFATTIAYGKTIKSPVYIGSNIDNIEIASVKTTGKATTIDFYSSDKNKLACLDTTCYLSDESSRVYKAKSLAWDKYEEREVRHIVMTFEPLPESCKIFDLVAYERVHQRFCIYGIHDSKHNPQIPNAECRLDENEYKLVGTKGTARIHGVIKNYRSRKMTIYHSTTPFEDSFRELGETVAFLNQDGTFDVTINLRCPKFAHIGMGVTQGQIPFFIRPGEDLYIEADYSCTTEGNIVYRSSYPTYGNLMNYMPPAVSFLPKADGESETERLLAQEKICLSVVDYLAWKYSFSPFESLLAKNCIRLSYANHLIYEQESEKKKSIVLNDIDFNDRSMIFDCRYSGLLKDLESVVNKKDSPLDGFTPDSFTAQMFRAGNQNGTGNAETFSYPFINDWRKEFNEYKAANSETLEIPTIVSSIIAKHLDEHNGKYIHFVVFPSDYEHLIQVLHKSSNIIHDFDDGNDLEVVFLVTASDSVGKELMPKLKNSFDRYNINEVSEKEMDCLRSATFDNNQFTIDRTGRLIRNPLNIEDEYFFRLNLYRILDREKRSVTKDITLVQHAELKSINVPL